MRARRFCFVVLVAGLVAAACASSASSYAPGGFIPEALPTMAPAATMGPEAAATPADLSGGYPVETPAQGVANPSLAAPGASSNALVPESQIVKTGTIGVQVAAIDDSVALATGQIHALGGWLAASDRSSSSAEDVASVTYRIPVDRFEDALSAMRKLGTKVLSEHTESTPVGGQIVDLQARIANLRASEKAIQAIMEKAVTIGDVLTVEQRLAEVQGQIEELSGQLAGLTDQASYSTLTVVFVVPVKPTPSPSDSPTPSPSPTATPIPWSAGDQAGQAAGALGEVGQATATLLIWVAILIVPITIGLVLLLALLGLLGRLLDPYRKRFLSFTVPVPVNFAQPMPPQPQYPMNAPGPRPEDMPKA